MADDTTVAQLILRIMADSSEVRAALNDASKATQQFTAETGKQGQTAASNTTTMMNKVNQGARATSDTFDLMSLRLRRVSQGLIFMGTALMAPVIGALAAANGVSGQVTGAFWEMKEASLQLAVAVGNAAVPVVERWTKGIEDLTKWFKSLNPELQKGIVQFLLTAGAMLIAVGTLARLVYIAEILTPTVMLVVQAFKNLWWVLTTDLGTVVAAVNWPLVAIITVVGLFATAWVNNWMGLRDITKAILGSIGATIDFLYDKLATIARTLGYVSGGMSWKDAWAAATKDVETARDKMKEAGIGMEQFLKNLQNNIAKFVDEVKKMGVTQAINNLFGGSNSGKGSDPLAEFKGFMEKDLGEMLKSWSNFSMQVAEGFTMMVKDMASELSTGLFDFMTGKFKSFQEYFADFGRQILKIITDIIAKLIVAWMFKQLLGSAFPGISKLLHEGGQIMHVGGYIKKAHEGLRPGEVPIIAQSGEGILSRNGMATLGGAKNLDSLNNGGGLGGGTTINLTQVIQAWGPEDIMRNKKALAAGIIDELATNGPFRGAIKKY